MAKVYRQARVYGGSTIFLYWVSSTISVKMMCAVGFRMVVTCIYIAKSHGSDHSGVHLSDSTCEGVFLNPDMGRFPRDEEAYRSRWYVLDLYENCVPAFFQSPYFTTFCN